MTLKYSHDPLWSSISRRIMISLRVIGNEMNALDLGIAMACFFTISYSGNKFVYGLDYYILYIGILGFISTIAMIVRFCKRKILPSTKNLLFIPLLLLLELVRCFGLYIILQIAFAESPPYNYLTNGTGLAYVFSYPLVLNLIFKFGLYGEKNNIVLLNNKLKSEKEVISCKVYTKGKHYIIAGGIVSIVLVFVLSVVFDNIFSKQGLTPLDGYFSLNTLIRCSIMLAIMLGVGLVQELFNFLINKMSSVLEIIEPAKKNNKGSKSTKGYKGKDLIKNPDKKKSKDKKHKVKSFRTPGDVILDGYFIKFLCTFTSGVLLRRYFKNNNLNVFQNMNFMVPLGYTRIVGSNIQERVKDSNNFMMQGTLDNLSNDRNQMTSEDILSNINIEDPRSVGIEEIGEMEKNKYPISSNDVYIRSPYDISVSTHSFFDDFLGPFSYMNATEKQGVFIASYCFFFMILFGIISMIVELSKFHMGNKYMSKSKKEKNKSNTHGRNIHDNRVFFAKGLLYRYQFMVDTISSLVGPCIGTGIVLLTLGKGKIGCYYITTSVVVTTLSCITGLITNIFWSNSYYEKKGKEKYRLVLNPKSKKNGKGHKNHDSKKSKNNKLDEAHLDMYNSDGSTNIYPKSRVLGNYEDIDMFPKSGTELSHSRTDAIQPDPKSSSTTSPTASNPSLSGNIIITGGMEINSELSRNYHESKTEHGIILEQPPNMTTGEGLSFLDL